MSERMGWSSPAEIEILVNGEWVRADKVDQLPPVPDDNDD